MRMAFTSQLAAGGLGSASVSSNPGSRGGWFEAQLPGLEGGEPTLLSRKKTRKPKVRTGCLACKQSHVKCCETKPHCKRCERLQRNCRYGPSGQRGGQLYSGALVFRNIRPRDQGHDESDQSISLHGGTTSRGSSSSRESSPRLPFVLIEPSGRILNASDADYFDIYKTNVASKLSHPNFWFRTVLREGERDDSIKHCIIAIGALFQATYRDPLRRPSLANPPGTDAFEQSHKQKALCHYDGAVMSFRKRVAMEGASIPPRSILIITFLFIVFELMQDNTETIDGLMTTAVSIIKDSLSCLRSDGSFNSRVAAAIDDEGIAEAERLLVLLTGFSIMSGRLHPELSSIRLKSVVLGFQIDMPHAKSSDAEIERAWDKFIASVLVRGFRVHTTLVDGSMNREDARMEQDVLQYQVRRWETWIRGRLQHDISEAQRRLLEIIVIGVDVTQMYASCFLDKTELLWDEYTPQCCEIIRIAHSVIDNTPAESNRWPLLDDKLAPLILHTVVGKCRDRRVREEGLALCRRLAGFNGSWHTRSNIAAAEVKLAVEEQGRHSTGFIPPESRYLITRCQWNEDRTELIVGLKAVVSDPDGRCVQKHLVVRPNEFGLIDRKALSAA